MVKMLVKILSAVVLPLGTESLIKNIYSQVDQASERVRKMLDLLANHKKSVMQAVVMIVAGVHLLFASVFSAIVYGVARASGFLNDPVQTFTLLDGTLIGLSLLGAILLFIGRQKIHRPLNEIKSEFEEIKKEIRPRSHQNSPAMKAGEFVVDFIRTFFKQRHNDPSKQPTMFSTESTSQKAANPYSKNVA